MPKERSKVPSKADLLRRITEDATKLSSEGIVLVHALVAALDDGELVHLTAEVGALWSYTTHRLVERLHRGGSLA